ncbi:MAG: hypothetical protein U1U88_001384 [Lawsonella clevelandensis]
MSAATAGSGIAPLVLIWSVHDLLPPLPEAVNRRRRHPLHTSWPSRHVTNLKANDAAPTACASKACAWICKRQASNTLPPGLFFRTNLGRQHHGGSAAGESLLIASSGKSLFFFAPSRH